MLLNSYGYISLERDCAGLITFDLSNLKDSTGPDVDVNIGDSKPNMMINFCNPSTLKVELKGGS